MPDEQWREAGDPACWLNRVCPDCGQFRDDPTIARCPNCGAVVDEDGGEGTRIPASGAAAQQDRDRDSTGRPRSTRPRDGLGRPLPHGAPGVRRQPEGVARSPSEALTEAQRLLDAGMPFHAHEVLEEAWKAAAEPERQLWRGLAQLAVGLTHAARGNATGAVALLRRAVGNIATYRDDAPYDIDVAGVARWASEGAAALEDDPASRIGRPVLTPSRTAPADLP